MRALTMVKVETAVAGSIQSMLEEIGRMGGSLSFTVTTDRNGWWAVCKEFPGIVAGGDNPTPKSDEIYAGAKQAVLTAFNVPSPTRKQTEVIEPTLREFSLSALCTM